MRQTLAALLFCAMFITGCRSRTIMVSIRNTGESPIHNVEVQYPGGSYGAPQIGPGYTHAYRIKPRSAGTIQITYVDDAGKQYQKSGPRVEPDQEGTAEITIKGGDLQFATNAQ
jgi:hypothetical protein